MDNNMAIILRIALSLLVVISPVTPAIAQDTVAFDAPATLSNSEHFLAQRQGRFLLVSLKTPHQVLSTSAINGGQSSTINYLVNHQSMEARGDQLRYMQQINLNRQQYHQTIASQLGVAPEAMALMGTAANMQQLARVEKHFADLSVTVLATAGVKGNAQRAGDPTQWYQHTGAGKVVNKPVPAASKQQQGSAQITDNQGTINIMVLINRQLLAGAQAKIAVLATEAKSAALAELAISSQSSPFLATGTGTDQLIIASPLGSTKPPLPSASGHLKLGELVGSAVREAVLKALRWQNALVPSAAGNVVHALARFGLTKERLLAGMQQHLLADDFKLASDNLRSLTFDSRASAAAYAYAELLNRIQFGNLPADIAPEALLDQASSVAVAVSAKPLRWPAFWQALSVVPVTELDRNSQAIDLFIAAMATGWQAKWSD
ncbi:MAG: adenosylcobinamide amidohydrolase [Paraglaciecola psychrophila]